MEADKGINNKKAYLFVLEFLGFWHTSGPCLFISSSFFILYSSPSLFFFFFFFFGAGAQKKSSQDLTCEDLNISWPVSQGRSWVRE